MPLSPGQILNHRYRILRLLGQGGFGTVYQAEDQVFGNTCAVKECLHSSVEAQEQFQREARMLRTLRHTNLPGVLDYFVVAEAESLAAAQTAYLVMDFIEGQDLDQMLARNGRPLAESQALTWIGQVCDALIYLHKQNPPVIHRDIKPTNIRITPTGDAILVDFGIAKQSQMGQYTYAAAQAVSPGFSPIEQYGGQSRTDARTDIYALGATLYMLLTGRPPQEATLRSPDNPLTPLRQLNPAVSPQVEQAVMHALEIYPSQRFASVSQFKEALLAQAPPVTYVARNVQPTATVPMVGAMAAPYPAQAGYPAILPAPTGEPPARRPAQPLPMTRSGAIPLAGIAALLGLAVLIVFGALFVLFKPDKAPSGAPATAPVQSQAALPGLAETSRAATQTAGLQALNGQQTQAAIEQAEAAATQAAVQATTAGLFAEQTYAAGTAVIQSMLAVEATANAGTAAAPPSEEPESSGPGPRIPAGDFRMGSENGEADEQPVHTVFIGKFAMDRYEVTNAQYAAFLNSQGNQEQGGVLWLDAEVVGGHLFEGDYWQAEPGYADHPVVNVTWYGAQAYCNWAGGRLPTEAEWEKAARGGLKGALYPWGNDAPTCKSGGKKGAQHSNCGSETAPVGSFGPNGYGLFDMAGNVWEWVADWYQKDYYEVSPESNPGGPDMGEERITRGGSFEDIATMLSVSYRNWLAPYDVSSNLGFRCVY